MTMVTRKPQLNRAVFTTTDFNSRSMGPLAALVQPCPQPGAFTIEVRRHGRPVRRIPLQVAKEESRRQLTIDLAARHAKENDCNCHDPSATAHTVAVNGVVVFYASSGIGGWSVRVTRADTEKSAIMLDSSKTISSGSVYSVTLLQPGTYSARTSDGKGQLSIVVRSPKEAKEFDPRSGQLVQVLPGGTFRQKSVEQWSGGTVAFHCTEDCQLMINMEHADDRHNEPIKRKPAPGSVGVKKKTRK